MYGYFANIYAHNHQSVQPVTGLLKLHDNSSLRRTIQQENVTMTFLENSVDMFILLPCCTMSDNLLVDAAFLFYAKRTIPNDSTSFIMMIGFSFLCVCIKSYFFYR